MPRAQRDPPNVRNAAMGRPRNGRGGDRNAPGVAGVETAVAVETVADVEVAVAVDSATIAQHAASHAASVRHPRQRSDRSPRSERPAASSGTSGPSS